MAKQTKVKKEQVDKVEAEYIPDIPAQMNDQKVSITITNNKNEIIGEVEDELEIIKGDIINLNENPKIDFPVNDRLLNVYQEEKPESGEILFLRHILHRQHSGGFGKHLDDEINERIKHLKSCL